MAKAPPALHPLVLLDTREQRPVAPFVRVDGAEHQLATTRRGLEYGDYSLVGLEGRLFLDRKSVPDLIATCTGGRIDVCGEQQPARERFERAIERALAATPPDGRQIRQLVIEGEPSQVWREADRGDRRFVALSIFGSLNQWHHRYGIAPVWAQTPIGAGWWIGKTLAVMWSEHTGGAEARKARREGYAHLVPWIRDEPNPEALEASVRAASRLEDWALIDRSNEEHLEALERGLREIVVKNRSDEGDDLLRVRTRLAVLRQATIPPARVAPRGGFPPPREWPACRVQRARTR